MKYKVESEQCSPTKMNSGADSNITLIRIMLKGSDISMMDSLFRLSVMNLEDMRSMKPPKAQLFPFSSLKERFSSKYVKYSKSTLSLLL